MFMRPAYRAFSLSYLTDLFPLVLESVALVHGLERYHSHLKTCHIQTAVYLSDSQSALALLSMSPTFPNPYHFV